MQARIVLAAIFVAFGVVGVMISFSVPLQSHRPMAGGLIVGAIWTTVLLGAIWMGKNWARYVILALLGLSVLLGLGMLIPALEQGMVVHPVIYAMLGVNLVSMLLIGFLPSIRHLTLHR